MQRGKGGQDVDRGALARLRLEPGRSNRFELPGKPAEGDLLRQQVGVILTF